MSLQSNHCKENEPISNLEGDGNKVNMSISELTQATDVSFSLHKRLDCDCEVESYSMSSSPKNPLCSSSSSSLSPSCLKRRVSVDGNSSSEEEEYSQFSGETFLRDFLSGIFDDIAQIQVSDPDDDLDKVTTRSSSSSSSAMHDNNGPIRKKLKLSHSRSLKSMHCLTNLSPELQNTRIYVSPASSPRQCSFLSPKSNSNSNASSGSCLVTSSSTSSTASVVVSTSQAAPSSTLCDSLLTTMCPSGLSFPSLPTAVSDSYCSSTDTLTQTSVPAVQVCESTALDRPTINNNTTNQQSTLVHQYLVLSSLIEPKESYGWFVDMDEDEEILQRSSAISNATESCRMMDRPLDLSFIAATAPKRNVEHDEEVEWAKAADTVDDVLGDFF
jgi:hypothetical protein